MKRTMFSIRLKPKSPVLFSTALGNKYKKALPLSVPVDKQMRASKILLSILSFNARFTVPMTEISETINVAKKIYVNSNTSITMISFY
jgi:hypothetical protein